MKFHMFLLNIREAKQAFSIILHMQKKSLIVTIKHAINLNYLPPYEY